MKHLFIVLIFTLAFVGVHCGDFVIGRNARLKQGRNKYSPIKVQPTTTSSIDDCKSLLGTRDDLINPEVEFIISTKDKIKVDDPPILVVSSARAADIKKNWAKLYYGNSEIKRKVFIVVNYLEFTKYKTELADKAVIVGCNPTADEQDEIEDEEEDENEDEEEDEEEEEIELPLYSTTMFGFGLNRYCAQKFAQASKFEQYWMMDDNVQKIGDKTLNSYELQMTQNKYLVIGASVTTTGSSFMEQVYLFSSTLPYYFSPMFQLSKEDVSLTSFLTIAEVKFKADASLKVEKLTTMKSIQNFQRDYSKILTIAKDVKIKQGKKGSPTPLLEWMYNKKDAYENVQYKDEDDLVALELSKEVTNSKAASKGLTLPLTVGVSNALEILLSDCVQRYAMPALFGANLELEAIKQMPTRAKESYDKKKKEKKDASVKKRKETREKRKREEEENIGKKKKQKKVVNPKKQRIRKQEVFIDVDNDE